MAKVVDIIGREITPGNFVVFTNNLYQVIESADQKGSNPYGYVRIILVNRSKTTRACNKYSKEMCLVSKEEYLISLLTKEHKHV